MDNIVHLNEQLLRIGTELCTTRKQAGLSQDEVAKWLNIDRRLIMQIEAGKSKNIEVICLYCDKLDIQILIKIG